jgi:hypothetical protein
MFSQTRIPNRQRARPSFFTSFAQGTGAAVSNDLVGVFAHSVSMTNAAKGFTDSLVKANPKQPSFEQNRNLLINKLQKGRKRLAKGKKRMGWLFGEEIKATLQQLVELENRLRQVSNWQGLHPLVREVNIALGYWVVVPRKVGSFSIRL